MSADERKETEIEDEREMRRQKDADSIAARHAAENDIECRIRLQKKKSQHQISESSLLWPPGQPNSQVTTYKFSGHCQVLRLKRYDDVSQLSHSDDLDVPPITHEDVLIDAIVPDDRGETAALELQIHRGSVIAEIAGKMRPKPK